MDAHKLKICMYQKIDDQESQKSFFKNIGVGAEIILLTAIFLL